MTPPQPRPGFTSYLSEPFHLPENQFALLRDLIHKRLGLYYENGRRELLQDRLAVRLAERGLSSFLDYYYLLKYDQESEAEWRRLQSTLAVRETYFFREFDQVQLAVDTLIPGLQSQRRAQPVRIWSAACSTGEEPYTLAIALQEARHYQNGPIEIMASDFDSAALQTAQEGIYRERSFRTIDPLIRARYFTPLPDGRFQLLPEIRQRVQFSYLNLMEPEGIRSLTRADQGERIDLIFCRNVFIYFSGEAIRSVVEQFYEVLQTPGYLFLGAAESLIKYPTPFVLNEMQKTFVYSKQA